MVSLRVIVATLVAFCVGQGVVRQLEVNLAEGTRSTELRPDCGNSSFFPSIQITAEQSITQSQNREQILANGLLTDTGTVLANSTPALALLPNVTRKVGFVHIGKAAGSTVELAFLTLTCHWVVKRDDGRPRGPTKEELAACYQRKHRDDSPFSDQVAVSMHLGYTPQVMSEFKNFTTFLYTVRNPISRMISAFNYLHPNNTESAYAQEPFPAKNVFYKRCFPHVRHLFRTVDSIYFPRNPSRTMEYDIHNPPFTNQTNAYCQYLAMTVLQGKLFQLKRVNVHLFYNYRYYWEYTGRRFPETEILALRTEHMWHDIQELDVATGGSGNFRYNGIVERTNPVAKTKRFQATRRAYRSMCCVLWEELDLFQKIISRAVNLSPPQKLESLRDVWDTCGIEVEDRGKYQVGSSGLSLSWYEWQNAECPPPKLVKPRMKQLSGFANGRIRAS